MTTSAATIVRRTRTTEEPRVTGKLRVGIIGCGTMARHHVDGYLTSGRYEVAAMADLDESAMGAMDTRFGITTKHYRDARAMLDAENLEVVSVCTWHTGHAPWTVAAAPTTCSSPATASE